MIGRQPVVTWIAAAHAVGVLAAGYLSVPGWLPCVTAPAAALVLAATILRPSAGGPFMRFACVFALFFSLGMLAGKMALHAVASAPLAQAARNGPFVSLRGEVTADPTVRAGVTSFVLRARWLSAPRTGETDELVRVYMRELASPPALGEELCLSGRLRQPRSTGVIDRRAQLRRLGIGSMLSSYGGLLKRRLPPRGARGFIYRYRAVAGAWIDAATQREPASILRGLLLGDRSRIEDDVNEHFARSGLAHVLAVSGLHVGLLAGIVLCIARGLRLGPHSRQGLLVAAIACYALLTGSHASVLRAGLMIVVAVLVWMLGRPRQVMGTIAVAALILFAWQPLLLFDAGCQLSFAAVIALVALGPRVQTHLTWLPGWARPGAGAAIAAQVGTAPLLALHFNRLSLVTVPANVAAVPAAGVALAVGLAGIMTRPVAADVAYPLLCAAGVVAAYMIAVARFFAELPVAAVAVSAPSAAHVAAYYATVWWCVRRATNTVLAWRVALILAVVVVLGMAGVKPGGEYPLGERHGRLTLTCLDVGQGDAILLQTARETVLVDGGASPLLLARNLADESARRIDVLFVTHDHSDHIGGLERLAWRADVGTVALASEMRGKPAVRRLLLSLRRRGVRTRLVRQGDEFNFEDGLQLAVLHPGPRPMFGSESDANNNSLVLRARYGRFVALLAGDLEREGEEQLLRGRVSLRADVLKVPHHGSSRGVTARFLRAVRPAVAVISVGADNDFGHPAPSTLERLRRARVSTHCTDREGDVTVITDGNGQTVVSEKAVR